MLYGEIALHPECLTTELERLSDLDSKFGFNRGALISQLPRYVWGEYKCKIKEDHIDGSSLESAFAEEVLKRLENAFVRFGRVDPKGRDWTSDVLKQHETLPFHAVVTLNGEQETTHYWRLNSKLGCLGEDKKTPRRAREFVVAISPLLRSVNRVSFIDPYFNIKENDKGQLKSEYLPFFTEVLTFCGSLGKKMIVEFHKEDRTNAPNCEALSISDQADLFERFLTESCPANVEVHIVWWNDNDSRAMHARHVLTELGAIKFDPGFGQPYILEQQNQPIDMSLVTTHEALEHLNSQFDEFETEMELAHRFIYNEIK